MITIPPKLSSQQVGALCPGYASVQEKTQGGFKTVYKGEKNGIPEILKVVSIPATDGTEDHDRFRDECIGRIQREVEILTRCKSPTLVKVASLPLAIHQLNGSDYAIYSEEFLDGDDLWKLLGRGGVRPPETEAKVLMKCLLEAIRELWSMRYIHRDIKPANVIKLNDPTRPFVLLDLGIAFSLIETALTIDPARVPATYRYLAPEMANPDFRSNLDYRSDLYTSALTVFEYASGQHPIARDSDDPVRTVSRALRQPPTQLANVRPDFSSDFCGLIDQLLKKKPTLRPANLEVLIQKMEA
jgi:serine/threonine protein kinase